MRIGVSPDATVAAPAMTGTKLPASFSCLKKSRPGWTSSMDPPLAREAAQTPEMAWLLWVGSPDRATCPLYSGLSRSAQSFGTFLTTAVFVSNARTP